METQSQRQHWYHDWTVAAALVLVATFIALLCFHILLPHKEPYYPGRGDPIVYWDMVQPADSRSDASIDGSCFCASVMLIALAVMFVPIHLSKHKFIVVPLMLLSGVLCYLTVVIAVLSGDDSIALYHIDTVERTHHHYHLTGGDVSSLDMPYSILILYECDADDTNCFGQRLDIYGGGWHRYDDVSLEYNDENKRLEVWERREIIYAITPDE